MPTTVSVTPPCAVQYLKNGRLITLGKIYRQLDGSLAFGTPYADRKFHTPSLPTPVLQFLLAVGCQTWIVRFDRLNRAYRLELTEVERLGVPSPDGELAVPFRHFERCPFPNWPFAERTVLVGP